MQNKFGWFLSAAALTAVLWFAGLLGMMGKSFDQLLDAPDRVAAMSQGAEWIMIGAMGIGFVCLAITILCIEGGYRRTANAAIDLGPQCLYILLGALFAWTLVDTPGLLILWCVFYLLVHLKLSEMSWYDKQRLWRRRTLHAQTVTTAAALLCAAYL